MKKHQNYTSLFIVDILYICVLIVILQNKDSITALHIVGVCGVYIVANSLYASYKKQLTFTHFMQFGAIGILAAVIALAFLT